MKNTGETPSLIRDINLNLVINILRNSDYSVTDLAQKLNLSNTAVTKIINELIDLKLVKAADKVIGNKAGRRKVNYTYNGDFGEIAVVNYAQKIIVTTDMWGNIKNKLILPDKIIDYNYILESISKLQTLGVNYQAICIVTIGKIDPVTKNFIYALNIPDYKNINLYNIFSESFPCPIIIKNDIFLGLVGEKKIGKITEKVQNGLYVYIGDSIGSGLILNSKLYEGNRGFAGEIGLFSSNQYQKLEDVVSIKTIIYECEKQGMILSFSEIVKLYHQNHPVITRIIEASAKNLAVVLKNISELLDLDMILLSGEFTQLGPNLLEYIQSYFLHFSYLNVKLENSSLQQEAILIGAIEEAISLGIKEILKLRKE